MVYDDHMYCEQCHPPDQKHMIDCWCVRNKDDLWEGDRQCRNPEHATTPGRLSDSDVCKALSHGQTSTCARIVMLSSLPSKTIVSALCPFSVSMTSSILPLSV